MKYKLFWIAIALITQLGQAQDKTAEKYAEQLDTTRIKATLSRLSSDKFAGRKSNEEGAQLAANYIAQQLKETKLKAGNKGSFEQNIEAYHSKSSNKYFNLADFNYKESYSYSNSAALDSMIIGEDIVFAGYGLYHASFNDFANIDIEDKIVLILKGEGPKNKFGVSCHSSRDVPNYEYIKQHKPRALLTVSKEFGTYSNYSSERLVFSTSENTATLPQVQINELLANRILEPTNKSVKQLKFESEQNCSSTSFEFKNEFVFNGDNHYKLANVNNLIGIIEGSDLKDEYIVLSAHYDHTGTTYRGEVYPGADDNASGVSAVLEIARVLSEAKKAGKGPRRTIIFLFPTAEEDGLYGSKYYVDNPIYPLDKTIACVNIDMIGRIGNDITTEQIDQGYVYALTGEREINDSLFNVPKMLNEHTTKLALLEKDKGSYSSFFHRSDHYNFYKKSVPSILFTNGSHDDLHKTTDDIDKIDFSAMLQRSKLVFLTVWELANNPKPFRSATEVTEYYELQLDDGK